MNKNLPETLLPIAREAAHSAGSILSGTYRADPGVQRTEGKDIKTNADLEAEKTIRRILEPTGIPILGEETGLSGSPSNHSLLWIIDPLDGTFNFVRGLPFCGVSIALWRDQDPLLGILFDLTDQSLLEGVVGSWARRDGEPIHVSRVAGTEQAALATGFPTQRDYGQEALQTTISAIQKYKKIRMLGSAALSLGQVACGRLEAYWEEDIWLWDVAAGLALVKAAGGDYTLKPGTSAHQFHVFAHNGAMPPP